MEDESKADDSKMEDTASKAEDDRGDEKGGEAMDIDEEEEKKPKKKKEPEPSSFALSNPCRITKPQADVCVFDSSQRYQPVRNQEKPCGVILVTDSTPGEEEDLGTVKPPSIESEDEAEAPEPFIWTPPGLDVTENNGDAPATQNQSGDD